LRRVVARPRATVELLVEIAGDQVRARRRGVSLAQLADLGAGRIREEEVLDLHGYSVGEAEAALERFVVRARRKGRRCVLVIHGRGKATGHSPVRDAVIAQLVGPLSALIHSVATAPPKSGGPGATYVMVKG